jgi:hypothetical protein
VEAAAEVTGRGLDGRALTAMIATMTGGTLIFTLDLAAAQLDEEEAGLGMQGMAVIRPIVPSLLQVQKVDVTAIIIVAIGVVEASIVPVDLVPIEAVEDVAVEVSGADPTHQHRRRPQLQIGESIYGP